MYTHKKKINKVITLMSILFLLFSFLSINSYAAEPPQINWIRVYNNHSSDYAYDVATDSNNNVIVTGASRISGMDRSHTIKYDTNGNFLFAITSDLTYASKTYGVAVDSENNIILAGGCLNSQSNYDYYTVKYDSSGNKLWTKTYNSGNIDIAYDVAIDSNDNIIVTGQSANKYYTIKYNKFGAEQWNKTFSIFAENSVKSVAIDNYDNIIVTGQVNTGSSRDWYTIKYNSDGQEIWNKTFSNGNFNYVDGVTTNSDNEVIVAGTVYRGTNSDIYLIKYDESGTILWSASFDYSVGDYAADVAINAVNDIIIAGSVFEQNKGKDYVLVKYNTNGVLLWSTFYDRGYDDDFGCAVSVDTQNDICITGFSKNAGYYDYLTIKYEDTISQDMQKPEITNVNDQPDPQYSGGYVNISCSVTDNIGINTVEVYITDPDNLQYNTYMSNNGIQYYYNSTYTIAGTYSYFIKAFDTSNNNRTSDTYYFNILTTVNNPPYQPSNPNPVDGAIDIDIDASLMWTGGDPDPGDTVTYDVYFGTQNPPVKIIGNQSETTYQPWTMNLDTTYYWQIVPWDAHGASSEGPVWSFTTISTSNSPPDIADTPDGQTSGSVNVLYEYYTYAFDPDDDNVSYGWDWDGDLVIDVWSDWYQSGDLCIMDNSWDVPGTYEIRVKTKDEHLLVNDTWSNALSVSILNNPPNIPSNPSPADGATDIGFNADLWWTGGDIDGDVVKYDVYFEAGDSTPDVLVSENQTEAYYDPGTLSADTNYYWQIIAKDIYGDFSSGDIWEFLTKESYQNSPPNKPINKTPINGAIDVNITPILTVHVTDPDGDALSVHFFNASNNELLGTKIVQNNSNASIQWSDLSYNTVYSWYAVANDSIEENISNIWSFTTMEENPPAGGGQTPPQNGDGGDTGGGGTNYLNPTADANGPYYGFTDIKIMFDGSNSHDNDENGQSIIQYDWKFFAEDAWHNNLGSKPMYSYSTAGEYIISLRVIDNEGATSVDITSANITDNPLIADANGPYFGAPKESIEFDASGSYSKNGDSLYYRWDWTSDENYDTQWLTSPFTTYSYENAGVYTITLQIKTEDNITATNKTYAIIQEFNNPPTNPIVKGTTIGVNNTNYSFSAVSTDLDNDTIRYIFNWDDSKDDTTTAFFANNTKVNVTHSWVESGVYNLQVYAEDENNALSGTTNKLIFIDIDTQFIEHDGISGYLVDLNSDGSYDAFYNIETGNQSNVEKLDDGSYLVDMNDDDVLDSIYDPDTDTIEKYEQKSKNTTEDASGLIWYIVSIITILIMTFLLILWVVLKKNKKKGKGNKKSGKK